MAVCIDHARHHDAARGVDLHGVVGYLESRPHTGDALADDEDICIAEDVVGVVHRQHGPAAQDDRTAGIE